MCGSKICRRSVWSGADDADVQHREVEVRDAAVPQLLRELVVARFEIAGGCDIACPQRPFDRGRQRCHQRLHHHDRHRETFGRPFLVREIVRVVTRSGRGALPSDRTMPIARNRSSARRSSSERGAKRARPRCRSGWAPRADRMLRTRGCAARSRGAAIRRAAHRVRAATRAVRAGAGGASGGNGLRVLRVLDDEAAAGLDERMTW